MGRIVVITVVQLGGRSRKCSFHWLSRINCTLHHNGVFQWISRIRWVKRKRGLSQCCGKIVLPSISHSCGNYEALSRSFESSHWRHRISDKIDRTANSFKRMKSRFRKTCKKNQILVRDSAEITVKICAIRYIWSKRGKREYSWTYLLGCNQLK